MSSSDTGYSIEYANSLNSFNKILYLSYSLTIIFENYK